MAGECWIWRGQETIRRRVRKPDGTTRAPDVKVARVVWEWVKGDPGPDVQLIPTCGRAACVNPAHRRLVEVAPRGTIGPDEYPAIRERYRTRAGSSRDFFRLETARYGVSRATLNRIIYDYSKAPNEAANGRRARTTRGTGTRGVGVRTGGGGPAQA